MPILLSFIQQTFLNLIFFLHPLQPPQHIIGGPLRQVQQWRIWCGWHCVRNYRNCNLLLHRYLRMRQYIVNCVTKGTQIHIGSGRTPHINDIHYTIRAAALRAIIDSSGNMCGYGDDRIVGGNGRRCRRSVDVSGCHIKGIKRRGQVQSFPKWGWWGYLTKCCCGRALMDVSPFPLTRWPNFPLHYL